MIKEFVISLIAVFLLAISVIAGINIAAFLLAVACIILGMYYAYHYRGTKNYWLSIGVLGLFILFMVLAPIPWVGTFMMALFFGLFLLFAWNAFREEPKSFGGVVNRACPNCGHILGLPGALGYCPNCGTKIDATP